MNVLRFSHKARQRGAIAPMTGLMLMLVLIPMAGLVLDLGHLYIAKAELQNLADASALAAAKDLDNSTAGVTKSAVTGKAIALKNKYDFSSTLTLKDANFEYAATPDGPWYSKSDTETNPTGRTFVKVDTRMSGVAQSFNTWLMRIAGTNTTSTYGSAVAGRYVNTVTPIGICAIDPLHRTAQYSYSTGITEVVEYGFRRGMAYNVFSLGSLGGASSDPYQINPVDAPGVTSCKASNASANVTAPFMCTGNSAVLPTGVGQVYTNTGMTASLDRALNSRFNDYGGGSKCDPVTAPPDLNVREYPCRGNSSPCVKNVAGTVSVTPPIDWMDTSSTTYPNQQSVTTSGSPMLPKYSLPSEVTGNIWPTTASTRVPTPATFSELGTLWSYTPAYQGNGITPITAAQANAAGAQMYGTAPGSFFDAAKYPTSVGTGFSASAVAAPYNQTGNSDYFQAPTGNAGQEDRRILNIVLIDCRTAPGGGGASCGTMNAVGIGKFFMLTKADFSGGTPRLDVEFTGLVEPVPTSEVKLYR
jgi:Flp pilus assembly protein TadG